MTEPILRDKFRGALLGTFVGDALGAPVEGWPADTLADALEEYARLPPGSPEHARFVPFFSLLSGDAVPAGSAKYTDDTQMTIGLAESLAHRGDFDGPDLARRWGENYEGWRGYGPGGVSACEAWWNGGHWDEAATLLFGGEGSFGNGAAMRAAPVGLLFHNDLPGLRRVAVAQAMMTHRHPLGRVGAVLQAHAIALAVRHSPEEDPLDATQFLYELRAGLPTDEPDTASVYARKLDTIIELLRETPSRFVVADALGTELSAHESVPAAIFAFLLNRDSFRDVVTYAVLLGGDTDTVAAMAGAMGGAYLGLAAMQLDEYWWEALENGARGRDYILSLANELFSSWEAQLVGTTHATL